MKALILAGGFGTRLRPLSCTKPKSLLPIVNKSLLEWTYERLANNHVAQAILAVNYQTEAAVKHHRIPKYGLTIKYSRDPLGKPLGTGGSIKRAERYLSQEQCFLTLNGDIFADVNYAQLLQAHQKKDTTATIALYNVPDPSRYGAVELGKDGRIKKFVEKPSSKTAPSNLINAGVYALSPGVFKHIPKNRAVSIEREVFPKLAEEGLLYGYLFNGLWFDIGKPEDYLRINRALLDTLATSGKHRNIGQGTQVNDPVDIDKGVSIGRQSVIGPYTIVGRDVTIGNNVYLCDSVVLPWATICDHSKIESAIIGDGAKIGERAIIRKGCIIGDHANIKDDVIVCEGASVCPAKQVTESILTPQNVC